MSKVTRARRHAHLEQRLEGVVREIRAIETSEERRAGSQLASALGVECHRKHSLRADKAREIMLEQGFTATLETEELSTATSVARNLQLFRGVPLRDLIAQRRRLERELRLA